MTPSIKSKTSYFTLHWALAVIVGVLLLDQCSKFYIKLNYPLSGYGVPPILDWGFFKILFVENSGMAMGTQLNDILPFINDEFAKLILTLFRLIAIGGLGYWLWNTLKKQDALLTFSNMATALRASASAKSWGVVTITAPVTGIFCAKES